MKITICASMHFSQAMLDIKKALEKMGHTVIVPMFTGECVNNPDINIDYDLLIENDCMLDHYRHIEKSDAVLIINNRRHGYNGYIGGSVLMEIGIAKYLDKKIFILNDLPDEKDFSYIFEVKLTQPIIINQDLSLIN